MSRPPGAGGRDPLSIDPADFVGGVTPFDTDYERPNESYRCGREGLWGKRCPRGPSVRGDCRGTTECAPALRNGRYECRRRAAAGGPCEGGPNPDGSCARRHPPCVPRRTLRAMRGRMTFIAALITVALVAAFIGTTPNGAANLSSLDPGPLTGGHANFTRDKGCVACHEPHGSGPANWIRAAFVSKPDGISNQCLDCHAFGGDPLAPHNADFVPVNGRAVSGGLTCTTCHTEHKGVDANIRGLSDAQCNSCHEKQFESFAEGHPEFPASYPHSRKNAIRFDHASHFGRHFVEARYVDRAPEVCSACHQVQGADLRVEPLGFEQSCASCHADNIPARELVLFQWPEIVENTLDAEEVIDICGPTRDQFEAIRDRLAALEAGEEVDPVDEEDFYGVSLDYMAPFAAFLLGVSPDDPFDYEEPVQSLAMEVLEGGILPIAERIDELASAPVSRALFARLNPAVVKAAFCAWAANTEYEIPADPQFGGWYADGTGLRYKPQSHAGMVARSWVDFALAAPRLAAARGDDEDQIERAIAFREAVTARDGGIGSCTKCHAVTMTTEAGSAPAAAPAQDGVEAVEAASEPGDPATEVLVASWRFHDAEERPYRTYSHRPHLNLLGEDMGCRSCHVLDNEAPYGATMESFDPSEFSSNFKPIQKETCTECHREGGVRQDCQLCHDYHLNPGFKLEIARHEEDAS